MNQSEQPSAPSYQDAPDIVAPLPPAPPSISVGDLRPPDTAKTLLGNRWLCRGGAVLMVGSAGMGKSSASMQQDLRWAAGKEAFGIQPTGPLKIVTIQAENDEGDMHEMREGVTGGLGLSDEETLLGWQNLRLVFEQSRTGEAFVREVVEPTLAEHRPDILRIDPLAAYAGADITQAAESARLLRTLINPLLTKYDCGLILVHHTPKTTNRDTSNWRASDWMYAGAGSADIVNWARGVLVIDATRELGTFKFIAAKRGGKIGWTDDHGEREFDRYYKHATSGVFWEPSEKPAEISKNSRSVADLMMHVPPKGQQIGQNTLLEVLKGAGVSDKPARQLIAAAVELGQLVPIEIPRSKKRPAIAYKRGDNPQSVPNTLYLVPGATGRGEGEGEEAA